MKSNKILITVEGKRRAYLVQTIMYHITMLFERLNSGLMAPKFFQKFTVEGKTAMVDMQVMSEIDSDNYKKILEEKIKKEQKMAQINIENLHVGGDAVIGDNGTINKNTILNVSHAFSSLAKDLAQADESELLQEVEALVSEEKKDNAWLARAKNTYHTVVARAKDINAFNKAGEVVGKLEDSESVKALQDAFSGLL